MTLDPSSVEKISALQLSRSQNVGPITYDKLLLRYKKASLALENLQEMAARGGLKTPLKLFPKEKAEDEIAHVEKAGGQIITKGEAAYPPILAQIADAPPVLTVLGDPWIMHRRSVAIVGARNASSNGRRFAHMLSHGVGKHDLVVVSGLARGIDAAAHDGALDTGTIAVLGGGADDIYPPENKDLYHQIKEKGCIVSEMPWGMQAQARHFPRRNRIVSGLSLATVVVEAALKSGSLITATFAADQGREVMAVPGSPLDPRSHGCNKLIREGATLIQNAQDVVEALGRISTPSKVVELGLEYAVAELVRVDENALDKARLQVLECLSFAPVGVDVIIRDTTIAPPIIASILLELELAGRIQRHPGNQISLLGREANESALFAWGS